MSSKGMRNSTPARPIGLGMGPLQFRGTAPAYMEYAADMLANQDFRCMSWEERGILHTLRLECWANGQVPAAPADLTVLLGRFLPDPLPPRVAKFFEEKNGALYSPDLEQYREHILDRRAKQSKAAAATNHKKRTMKPADGDGKVPSSDTGAAIAPSDDRC